MIASAAVALIGVSAVIAFQDNLSRFLSNPRQPFQITIPPSPPDYAEAAAWALRPVGDTAHEADVFYIHSTTYYKRRRWNAPADDQEAVAELTMVAAPNEAGPFLGVGDIHAPRYREATLYSQFTQQYDGVAARRLAYGDVRRAFEAFLATRDERRPLFIVAYGQGGLYALGLLRDFFQGPDNLLRRRLVAAYVIGYPTPAGFLDGLGIPVCAEAPDVRCVVAYADYEKRFDEEMARLRTRMLTWSDEGELTASRGMPFVCVNPLSWTPSTDYEEPDGHVGAASATGIAFGREPPARTMLVGARCEDGILVVDTPRPSFLRRGAWFGAKWRAQPFNLFYYDLADNAAARLAALQATLAVEPDRLAPIEQAVDLGVSPIRKPPR